MGGVLEDVGCWGGDGGVVSMATVVEEGPGVMVVVLTAGAVVVGDFLLSPALFWLSSVDGSDEALGDLEGAGDLSEELGMAVAWLGVLLASLAGVLLAGLEGDFRDG